MFLFIRQDAFISPLICFCLNHPFLFLLSLSFFLSAAFLPPPRHTRAPPFLVERPGGAARPAGASQSLPSNTFITQRARVCARSRQTLLWLLDSFAQRSGKS